MEDVREYYPLYLGCEVMVTTEQYGLQGPPNKFKGVLRGYSLDQWKQQEFAPALQVYVSDTTYYFYKPEQVKLIVRRLDSMTEEEAKEFCRLEGWGENLENIVVTDSAIEFTQNERTQAISRFTRLRPQMFIWLLSKGFWLFDPSAFDKGLIIDSKTLNKEV